MCPITLEMYQKHTNNLKKLYSYFLTIGERRGDSHREPLVSLGLRLSLLVWFFPLLWLDVSHTGCSITSHKFLMSHSPVTFNCVWFLLPDQTWTGGTGGWWQQWEPGRRGDSGRYYNESFLEHRPPPPSPPPSALNEGWVLAPVSQHQQHFLFGKHFNGIPLRDRQHQNQPEVVKPMSTYIFITC